MTKDGVYELRVKESNIHSVQHNRSYLQHQSASYLAGMWGWSLEPWRRISNIVSGNQDEHIQE